MELYKKFIESSVARSLLVEQSQKKKTSSSLSAITALKKLCNRELFIEQFGDYVIELLVIYRTGYHEAIYTKKSLI